MPSVGKLWAKAPSIWIHLQFCTGKVRMAKATSPSAPTYMPQPKRSTALRTQGYMALPSPSGCIAACSSGSTTCWGAGNALYDLKGKKSFPEKSNPRLLNFPTSPLAFITCALTLLQKMNSRHRLQARLINACCSTPKTQGHIWLWMPVWVKLR